MSGEGATGRTLVVLADGVQAAFAAGVVRALADAGVGWRESCGAGLGVQVAVLALLGEAGEGARRWQRQAELGSPIMASRLAAARERLGAVDGLLVLPDAWTLTGWLDPATLVEHLAPEAAGLPERLGRRGARCLAAVEDLVAGSRRWVDLAALGAAEAAETLRAAAAFPAGWPPAGETGSNPRWGGVGAIPLDGPWPVQNHLCDIVCGFPVPAVARSSTRLPLLESLQRRDEIRGAELVGSLLRSAGEGTRLLAPNQASWAAFAERDGADVGLEYPLPWEHNGELTGQIVAYGGFVAGAVLML